MTPRFSFRAPVSKNYRRLGMPYHRPPTGQKPVLALMGFALIMAAGAVGSPTPASRRAAIPKTTRKSKLVETTLVKGPSFRLGRGFGMYALGGASQKSPFAAFPISPNTVGLFQLGNCERVGTVKLPWVTKGHYWSRRMAVSSGADIFAVSLGRPFATGRAVGRISVYRARNGKAKLLKSFSVSRVPILLTLSPSGDKVLAVSKNQVEIYKSKTGKCLFKFARRHQLIMRSDFTADGRTVAIAPNGPLIRLVKWSGRSVHVTKIHALGGNVVCVAFGPGGHRLYAAISGPVRRRNKIT